MNEIQMIYLIITVAGVLIVGSVSVIWFFVTQRLRSLEESEEKIFSMCNEITAIRERQEGQMSLVAGMLNQQTELAVLSTKITSLYTRIDELLEQLIRKGVI